MLLGGFGEKHMCVWGEGEGERELKIKLELSDLCMCVAGRICFHWRGYTCGAWSCIQDNVPQGRVNEALCVSDTGWIKKWKFVYCAEEAHVLAVGKIMQLNICAQH